MAGSHQSFCTLVVLNHPLGPCDIFHASQLNVNYKMSNSALLCCIGEDQGLIYYSKDHSDGSLLALKSGLAFLFPGRGIEPTFLKVLQPVRDKDHSVL